MSVRPVPDDLEDYETIAPHALADAMAAARRYLLSIQHADGHWCGELEGDTILESEYALTFWFLGRGNDRKVAKAGEYLRRKQLPEGGWSIYPGGPAEVSASVKAYFVLKLLGDDPAAPHMAKARAVILRLGGVDACNSFTKIYLAIFGQYPWSGCPGVPPEIVLLPDGFVFNIYKMSSWSRAIVVPLSIIWAHKPSCKVDVSIDELFADGVPAPHVARRPLRERLWRSFFTGVDVLVKGLEATRLTPLRARALRTAEEWILARLKKSDGLGAIFPPIINTIIAFRALGYALDDAHLVAQIKELERLEIEDDETLHVQPCFSPVWDTALSMVALRASGAAAEDPSLLRAASWLLDREVREVGDWKKANPEGPVGGWYFEYANEFYPDCDDVAEVLSALATVRFPEAADDERRKGALERGLAWQLSMQNADGGWGAFDKGCDNEVLTFIPFADHNAMIDPSCEDITGRTLEAMSDLGRPADDRAAVRARDFLVSRQESDGTWYGRWGCNYVYGTWLALRGLGKAGVDLSAERYQKSAAWIRRHQNEDGGWGELPLSYDDPSQKGKGPSTPSQTAWGLMALFAAGDRDSDSVRRGLAYLLASQEYDGSWNDTHWTGTGFPKVFYLRYHLYATYFPLWAISEYAARGIVSHETRGKNETTRSSALKGLDA